MSAQHVFFTWQHAKTKMKFSPKVRTWCHARSVYCAWSVWWILCRKAPFWVCLQLITKAVIIETCIVTDRSSIRIIVRCRNVKRWKYIMKLRVQSKWKPRWIARKQKSCCKCCVPFTNKLFDHLTCFRPDVFALLQFLRVISMVFKDDSCLMAVSSLIPIALVYLYEV